MCLAVSLDLCDLIDPLAESARFCILAVDPFSSKRFDDGKHTPIAEIAVVCDRQHMAPSFFLIATHPLPQVSRIVATQWLLGGVRLNQAGLASVITKNDVAMEVVSPGIGSPFIPDERSEAAGLIGFFGGFNDLLPGAFVSGRSRDWENG